MKTSHTRLFSIGLSIGIVANAMGPVRHVVAAEPPDIPTFREFLERSVLTRETVDRFLKGPAWGKFDPELGYVLGNYLPADGIDGSATISTVQANGARTSFMYAGRKCRINTYGDSFTQGQQVSDGETWQEYLAAHLGEPIRNFGVGGYGVYQAYRRMVREEQTDHGAEYMILYIWGDDHIRSLLRCRHAIIYPWWKHEEGRMFQGNFWSHVELDLETGRFVEKDNLLSTPASLYHMTDPQWMADHLHDDLALQLFAFKEGRCRDLDRSRVNLLATRLDFSFDWSQTATLRSQAGRLLDRYSLRATQFILDKSRAFAASNGKKLMVALFDPSRTMTALRDGGPRYDQEIVDYLIRERVNYFDMNEVHFSDFRNYKLSWEEYRKRYFIGHYNPAGNHFFAHSIKDKVVAWLDPKPMTYQKHEPQTIDFENYLRGQPANQPVDAPPASQGRTDTRGETKPATIRVAAAQAEGRVIDFRLTPDKVLAAVDKNLTALESIVKRAGRERCDVLVLPEDTMGLLNWIGMNEASEKQVLPAAVQRMLERLGRAAARHRMYLVVCSDHLEVDGGLYNTAFLLGRDSREMGRYHKTCPTWSEGATRRSGTKLPVFPTPDLGTAGMLICYDLVMPETARALALQGADIICFPTMGGAAIGDGDIGVQALRVRAVENFVYLVVAHRGSGAMIISPQGKILAEAKGADGLAIADIDPRGGREGGDASNWQRDMRARLFRERNPATFAPLVDPEPAVLEKAPITLSREEAGRIMARMLTIGEEEFDRASALARGGRTNEAIAAFEKLRRDYRDSWIDRAARERIEKLRNVGAENSR